MTHDPQELEQFLGKYESHVKEVLVPIEKEVRKYLHSWLEPTFWSDFAPQSRVPTPSPIHTVRTRIKRPESVVDKILRKPSVFTDGLTRESIVRMHDTFACRAIVYFLSNLPLVDAHLRSSEHLEISQEHPPVAFLRPDLLERCGLGHLNCVNKDSGYSSIHYIVRVRESSVPKEQRPWFEIQIRTLAEHVWGEIEHILGYKPEKRTSFAVKRQFQIIGSQLTSIDEHFNLLAEELRRFQLESAYRESDPLNAENLPAVLNNAGIGCAQKEIGGLLKLLDSRHIEKVADLQDIADNTNLDIIKNTYRRITGHDPSNFEIVACLAAIKGISEINAIDEAIQTQVNFLKAWEEFKKRP